MAAKGDRAYLEPQAQRMYAEGMGLSAISAKLGVSVTSLSKWKSESLRPGDAQDAWDFARNQRKSNIQRLRELFDDQLAYLEGLTAAERDARMLDTLAKMGGLLERWDKIEQTQRVVERVFSEGEAKKEITPEQLAADIRQVYGV